MVLVNMDDTVKHMKKILILSGSKGIVASG